MAKKPPSIARQFDTLISKSKLGVTLDRKDRRQLNAVDLDEPVSNHKGHIVTESSQTLLSCRIDKMKQFRDNILPWVHQTDFLSVFTEKFEQYSFSAKYPSFPLLSCFYAHSRTFTPEISSRISAKFDTFVIQLDSLSANSTFESTYVNRFNLLSGTDFCSLQEIAYHIHTNHLKSKPFVIVFNAFNASADFTDFLRLIIDLRKIFNINFILILLTEIIRPINELIGNELTNQLEVIIVYERNQKQLIGEFLFHFFTNISKLRVSLHLLHNLLLFFAIHDKNVYSFVHKLTNAADQYFLSTLSPQLYENPPMNIVNSFFKFGTALNLVIIATDLLCKNEISSALDVTLMITLRNNTLLSFIAEEIDKTNPFVKLKMLFAQASTTVRANVFENLLFYLKNYAPQDNDLISLVTKAKEQQLPGNCSFTSMKEFKENFLSPKISNLDLFLNVLEQYVLQLNNVLTLTPNCSSYVIDFNGVAMEHILPSQKHITMKITNETESKHGLNTIGLAFCTLKLLSLSQNNAKTKWKVNMDKWKLKFIEKVYQMSPDNKYDCDNLFISATNELRYMGVLTHNDKWNPIWSQVPIEEGYFSEPETKKSKSSKTKNRKRVKKAKTEASV